MNTAVTVKNNSSIQNVLTKIIDKRQEDSATNRRLGLVRLAVFSVCTTNFNAVRC
jgi:hypothetical protein